MGGLSYKSDVITNVWKGQDNGRNDWTITYLPQPVYTDKIMFSGITWRGGAVKGQSHPKWNRGHYLRFQMEMFGCQDYTVDKCKSNLKRLCHSWIIMMTLTFQYIALKDGIQVRVTVWRLSSLLMDLPMLTPMPNVKSLVDSLRSPWMTWHTMTSSSS